MAQTIMDQMKKLYDSLDFKYQVNPKTGNLIVAFPGEGCLGTMIFVLDEDEDGASIHVTFENDVPEEARMDTLEFMNMANAFFINGKFGVSLSDGSLFFRAYVKVFNKEINDETATYLFSVAHSMVKKYYDPLCEVVSGTKTPEEAMNMARK